MEQEAGSSQPLSSFCVGQGHSPSMHIGGQGVWQIAVGSFHWQYPGISHPFASAPFGQYISFGPQFMGQWVGHLGSILMHVSGIGHPCPSFPPGHCILPSPQCIGQWNGQLGSLAQHESGILHPWGSISPGHISASASQWTGHIVGWPHASLVSGSQVSGIGQPSLSLPPEHCIVPSGHILGHVAFAEQGA